MIRLDHPFPAIGIAASLLVASPAAASPQLDTTFGTGGIVSVDFGPGLRDEPRDMLVMVNGDILVAGESSLAFFDTWVSMCRLHDDGVLDAGFGVAGKVQARTTFRDLANAIALQPDGRIVAAGSHWDGNGGSQEIPSVYRFFANGATIPSPAESTAGSRCWAMAGSWPGGGATPMPTGARTGSAGRSSTRTESRNPRSGGTSTSSSTGLPSTSTRTAP